MSFAAFFRRPFIAYNGWLEKKPLLTKSLTSGVMYAAGDAIAQVGEHYNAKKSGEAGELDFDWNRLGIFFVYGVAIAGPLYHYWFNNLDRLPGMMWRLRQHHQRKEIMRAYTLLRRHGIDVTIKMDALPAIPKFNNNTEKVMKILADQLVFSSLYTLIFFIAIGVSQGAVEKFVADYKRQNLAVAHDMISSRFSKEERLKSDLLRIREVLASQQIAKNGGSITEEQVNALGDDAERLSEIQRLETIGEHTESIDRILNLLKAEQALLSQELNSGSLSWKNIFDNTWNHTKKVYWPTYLADCVVWPGLQLINFSYVPVQYRFLFVNVGNLFWNTFLSVMANKSH